MRTSFIVGRAFVKMGGITAPPLNAGGINFSRAGECIDDIRQEWISCCGQPDWTSAHLYKVSVGTQ